MERHLKVIKGNWNLGVALDLHTKSSTPIINDDGEITGWDTERTEIGEELYRLKYWTSENTALKLQRIDKLSDEVVKIINQIIKLIKDKKDFDIKFSYIIPVLPSKSREFQPVIELAKEVANKSGIPLGSNIVRKVKSTDQLKQIEDEQEREDMLNNAFDVEQECLSGKNVVLVDDLYRSGSTLKAITTALKNKGKAKNVIVVVLTKTRSKR